MDVIKSIQIQVDSSVFSVGSGDVVSITYSDLKALRDSGGLLPGRHYRITDYACTTTDESTQSAGHSFDIIVTAISASELNENVKFAKKDGDTYFEKSNLKAWEGKYSIDTDIKPWSVSTKIQIYTDDEVWAQRDSSLDGTGSEKQYAWSCPGYVFFSDTENPSVGDSVDTIVGDGDIEENYSEIQDKKDAASQQEIENYKGTIYYLKDEFENEAYYDFKNIKFKRYAITDVSIIGMSSESESALKEIFLSGSNGGVYYAAGEEIPQNISYSGGASGSVQTSITWTIDTNSSKYYYTFGFGTDSDESISGSCYANTIGYDSAGLNNIVMGANSYGNSFKTNCRLNTFGNNNYNNTFGNSCNQNTFGNNNNYNTFGNGCSGNTFGNGCGNNTFGNNNYSNTFGNYFRWNTFGNDCGNNTFGNENYNNTFGNNNYRNTFGNNCSSNTFGNYFQNNTFGNSCNQNTFGNENYYNTFGNDNYYNTFGNVCQNNTFGNNNYNNTFGNNNYRNTFGNYFVYNTVDEDVAYLDFTANYTTGDGAYMQHIHILNGYKYNNLTAVPSGIYLNANYCQMIGFNTSGNFVHKNPLD